MKANPLYIYIFSLKRASKLGRSAQEEVKDSKVGVIGGGVMGAGIAASLLAKGFSVALVELSSDARIKAEQHIKKSIQRRRSLNSAQKEEKLANLEVSNDLSIVKGSALVVEAIVESLEIKQKVFTELAPIIGEEVILASNTSSLSIAAIGGVRPQPRTGNWNALF